MIEQHGRHCRRQWLGGCHVTVSIGVFLVCLFSMSVFVLCTWSCQRVCSSERATSMQTSSSLPADITLRFMLPVLPTKVFPVNDFCQANQL